MKSKMTKAKKRKAREWYMILDDCGIQWGEVLEDYKDSLEQLSYHKKIGPCRLVKVREVTKRGNAK